jgi:HEAT repeat protein
MPSSPSSVASSVEPLVHALAGNDELPPWTARRALEALGPAAVPFLVSALSTTDPGARWEAARALATIADPQSMPALIGALDDDDPSVRWLAAEGLAHIGPASLEPLLRALIGSQSTAWLRDGAHHVFRALMADELAPILSPVVRAMERSEPEIPTMSAASYALKELESMPPLHPAQSTWQWHPTRLPVMQAGHGPWRHIAMRL